NKPAAIYARVSSDHQKEKPRLDEKDTRIIEALRKKETLSTAQIARSIGRSPRGTRTRLQSLVHRGLIVEIGSGATDPRKKVHVARHGRPALNLLGSRPLPSPSE